MQLRNAHFAWLGAGLLMAGCASPGPSTTGRAVAQMAGSDRVAVSNAAELALTGLGYRIDRRNVSAGILAAHAASGEGQEQYVRRPLRLSSGNITRRVAEVRVEGVGETVSVYCQVLVQEQTTQAHRLLGHEQRGYDTPTDTAIDRDAATTTQQNTVWRTISRDRDGERRILAAITDSTNSSE